MTAKFFPEVATGNGLAAPHSACEALLSKAGVSALTGMSPRTIDNWLSQGLPHLRIGARRCRFDAVEVKAWLRQKFGHQRFGPDPEAQARLAKTREAKARKANSQGVSVTAEVQEVAITQNEVNVQTN
jgi:predicted DNA-binding transcriptional regulator AlpA